MSSSTGIQIFYKARYWNIFNTPVACIVRTIESKSGDKQYKLKPNSRNLINLQPNEKYEIIVGVVQLISRKILFTAEIQCTIKEGEIQNFTFSPASSLLGKSVLLRE